MKHILLFFITLFSLNGYSQAYSVLVCESNAKDFIKSKNMKYYEKYGTYMSISELNKVKEVLTASKNSNRIYALMKNYSYFTDDSKLDRIYKLYMDSSFEKNEDFIDEDDINATQFYSIRHNIAIIYKMQEDLTLSVIVSCLNNK